jgi:hypothetical protein
MFNSLGFLATTDGELCLNDLYVPIAAGAGPTRSIRSRAKKRHLMRWLAPLSDALIGSPPPSINMLRKPHHQP